MTAGQSAVSVHPSQASRFAIGVDVGGTFTDLVCSDGVSCWRAKSPTEPADFGAGVLAGLELLAAQIGFGVEGMMAQVARFGLGTTAVTNVLATRKGRRVGLITTAGFEGHLRAARGRRTHKEGWLELPWSPVADQCVAGVAERVNRHGVVRRELEDADLVAAARSLVDGQGINAFAVSFLWSCRNPVHEQRAVELLQSHFPSLPVFSGVALLPVMREYERTTTAALNAFCADALDGVDALETKLEALGMTTPMLLMHASGGTMTVEEGRRTPLGLASSGPAAGAVAAASLLTTLGIQNAVCADMGGTSIDVAVIEGGTPVRRQRGEVNGIFTAQSSIDVESVGAGGGSIAWIDSRELLRVGPQSARATPGPVCYGRGGTEPTVTDAMVVLGYIDPARFIGGTLLLDRDAAFAACERLGARIGLDVWETAWGIREIAMAEMAKTVRARLATSGLDPRELALVAYGGSGSLFTTAIAKEVGVPRIVTPRMASVFSAFGAAVADLRRERVEAIDRLLPADPAFLADRIAALRASVANDLSHDGVEPAAQTLKMFGHFRFFRQKWELTLPLEQDQFDSEATGAAFRRAYAARYSEGALAVGAPVEMVVLQAIGEGRTVRAVTPVEAEAPSDGRCAPDEHRELYLGKGVKTCVPTYVAENLVNGDVIAGPALIDAIDTTLWVPDGAIARRDARGTFVTEVTL